MGCREPVRLLHLHNVCFWQILLQKSAIKSKASRGFSWNHPLPSAPFEGGEDAVVLATATVMQHTRHRLVVVEQPVWRAAVGSVQ